MRSSSHFQFAIPFARTATGIENWEWQWEWEWEWILGVKVGVPLSACWIYAKLQIQKSDCDCYWPRERSQSL